MNEYLRTTDVHNKPSKNTKWNILNHFFGEKATARQKAAHEQDEHNLNFEKAVVDSSEGRLRWEQVKVPEPVLPPAPLPLTPPLAAISPRSCLKRPGREYKDRVSWTEETRIAYEKPPK